MRYGLFLNLCIFCLSFTSLPAQYTETEEKIIVEVKQFGQFVKRFNYEEDFWGNPADSTFFKKITRETYVDLLFDKNDPRLDVNDTTYTEAYTNLKNEFINEIVEKEIRIKPFSENLYARLHCSFAYQNQVRNVQLTLKQEIENQGYKWVLYQAHSDIFPAIHKDSLHIAFIPPTNNELYFSRLKSVFRTTDVIANYTHKDYVYDGLSTLLYLMKKEEMVFKSVNDIQYHIFDIPGWLVTVREFKRNSYNSGWLISDLKKWNNSPETFYKQIN